MRAHLGVAATARRCVARLAASEPARPVPGAGITAATPSIRAGDRDVRVVMAMSLPRVVVFADLLSADECDELIALARSRLARSETVETRDRRERGQPGAHERRHVLRAAASSRSARASSSASRRCSTGRSRTARACRSCATGPAPSTCRTTTTSIPAKPGTPAILKRGGQRVGSLVCYLNTPEAGGATVFPDIGLEVAPVQRQRRSSSATTGRTRRRARCTAARR